MPWREVVTPAPMSRVALVAPQAALRDMLVRVAAAGTVEIDRVAGPGDSVPGDAARRLQRLRTDTPADARLAPAAPDLDALEQAGEASLLAGEAELETYREDAIEHGSVAALVGWTPSAGVVTLSASLAEVGGAVVPLPRPPGSEPPTMLRREGAGRTFTPLVETYGTVPYRDVDPTVLAGLAYIVMFGVMFGDAGHGALILLGALLIRAGWPRRLAALRPRWLFVAGAGLASMLAGLAYGEFFGPTGLVPVLWLSPLEEPVTLLVAGVGLGAVLLAGAYALGTVNRVREGGWSFALYAPSGIAGSLLFLAAGLVAGGWSSDTSWLTTLGITLAMVAIVLAFAGLLAGSGGGAGVLQAVVELFDLVIRLGSNVVSFARLAAFGLTHAALGWLVWTGTTGLWQRGGLAMVAAVAVFVLGNAVAFSLEALVAGVQALRLEYYELFSRVFQQQEGRPFRPWYLPIAAGTDLEEAP
jgi:V/A-type H+/Na+-transporting ATPase subunit I